MNIINYGIDQINTISMVIYLLMEYNDDQKN